MGQKPLPPCYQGANQIVVMSMLYPQKPLQGKVSRDMKKRVNNASDLADYAIAGIRITDSVIKHLLWSRGIILIITR